MSKKDEKSTDDIQNGGKKTVEERITALEKVVDDLVLHNCLLKEGPRTHA